MQQEPLAAAQELCERLLVRAESLRMGNCQAGVQYRHFFAWLLRTVRRLNDDNPSAATEAAAIKVDPSNVAAFLHGQFCTDMVGPELKVKHTLKLQYRSATSGADCMMFVCKWHLVSVGQAVQSDAVAETHIHKGHQSTAGNHTTFRKHQVLEHAFCHRRGHCNK